MSLRPAVQSWRSMVLLLVCLMVLASTTLTQAADEPNSITVYEQQVRGILQKHCYKCHSHENEKPKGDLLVDSAEAMLMGGESGPSLIPGRPEKSLLIEAVSHQNGMKMPPDGPKLSAGEISALSQWIKLGGKGPKVSSNLPNGPTKRTGKITPEDKNWWAFRPIVAPPPPAVKQTQWVRNPIDKFVLAKLEAEGLAPAPEASRTALVRRLYFDVWGLPPSPQEVADFVNNKSDQAYEALVEKLLASPHYGEKWARPWLDLVRYADSDGYRIDDFRPHAWRYRDYVIRSLNTDKPYTRFVQEQLAGDELFPGDPDAQIATGYLCHWIYEYNNRDAEGHWKTILNDITDTTGDVFLGLGLQCARCHDHKFDPILQKDYYRLQAFFAALKPYEEFPVATAAEKKERAAKQQAWEAATADIRAEIEAIEAKYRKSALKEVIEKFPEEVKSMLLKQPGERTPYEQQIADLALRQATYEYNRLDRKFKAEDKEKIFALRRKLAEFDKLQPPPVPLAMTATDLGPTAPEILVPKKGKEPVAPGFITVLDEQAATITPVPGSPQTTGRRAALAQWLTQPSNPLTARVVVNRAWQAHFGHGLAANASDFGKLGEQPTHPELLDYLASRFMSDGWSLKKLHRQILLSATYRQAANHPDPTLARQKDPENRWYWRANTRRLEAEQIRDAILAVSGELKSDAGGPGVDTSQHRRTVYCKIMRNARDPLLDVFDAPYWFQSASGRDSTTTPVQSLLLFNSPFMLKRADALLGRIEKEASNNDEAKIRRAYELVFGREATSQEVARATEFLNRHTGSIDLQKTGSAQAAFVGDKVPHRDGQAAVINPHGEQKRFDVPHHKLFDQADFTIEAYILLKSVYDTGAVRTVAAKWDGSLKSAGWGFGVTGKKSRRKPQTLVLQMIGKKLDGTVGEAAIFSDQNIQLNKPYYLCAAVELAKDDREGRVTFHVKDLSNDDEPLLTTVIPHSITGGLHNQSPFTMGGRVAGEASFDGLIDDVRLSEGALGVDQLLFTNEGVKRSTIGYWQFEAKPDVFADNSGNKLHIVRDVVTAKTPGNARRTALRDLCHILLNSNEFLYVE